MPTIDLLLKELEKKRKQYYGNRLTPPEPLKLGAAPSYPVENKELMRAIALLNALLAPAQTIGSLGLSSLAKEPADESIFDRQFTDPKTGEQFFSEKIESFLPYLAKGNPKLREQYKKVFGFDPLGKFVITRSQREPGNQFQSASGRGSIFSTIDKPEDKARVLENAQKYRTDLDDEATIGGGKTLLGTYEPSNPLLVNAPGSPKVGLVDLLAPGGDFSEVAKHNPHYADKMKSGYFDREKVLAKEARRGGYDSVISYTSGVNFNSGKKVAELEELMDLKRQTNPRWTEFSPDGTTEPVKTQVQRGQPGLPYEEIENTLKNLLNKKTKLKVDFPSTLLNYHPEAEKFFREYLKLVRHLPENIRETQRDKLRSGRLVPTFERTPDATRNLDDIRGLLELKRAVIRQQYEKAGKQIPPALEFKKGYKRNSNEGSLFEWENQGNSDLIKLIEDALNRR
jgi:hypothetical protein